MLEALIFEDMEKYEKNEPTEDQKSVMAFWNNLRINQELGVTKLKPIDDETIELVYKGKKFLCTNPRLDFAALNEEDGCCFTVTFDYEAFRDEHLNDKN